MVADVIYFIVMPDGHKMFTYEPRIVAKWKALGGSVLENPVDSDGEAFTGRLDQTLSVSVDATIDVIQHENAAAASAAIAAEKEALLARLAAIELLDAAI